MFFAAVGPVIVAVSVESIFRACAYCVRVHACACACAAA
jgi:hypothetical protein